MTPPSPAITVRIVGATDVEADPRAQRDNFTVLNVDTGEVDFHWGREIPMPASGALLVVCDGMGAPPPGEVASHMAVEVPRRETGVPRAPRPPHRPPRNRQQWLESKAEKSVSTDGGEGGSARRAEQAPDEAATTAGGRAARPLPSVAPPRSPPPIKPAASPPKTPRTPGRQGRQGRSRWRQ